MWQHVDWERRTILIHSRKTEHLGNETRLVPIFPELMPYLQDAWEVTPEGQDVMLPMLERKSDSHSADVVRKAIRAAALDPWPKLFNAMRATRDTELRRKHSAYLVDASTGHTERMARAN